MLNNRMLAAALVIALIPISVMTQAHDGATGVVKERMDVMEDMKRSMKAIAPIFKGVLPYKSAEVVRNVKIINSTSGENLTKLYPEGSDQKPSDAKQEIWDNWDHFSQLAGELERLSSELITAAEQDPDTAPISEFKAMAKNCKACHDKYRED